MRHLILIKCLVPCTALLRKKLVVSLILCAVISTLLAFRIGPNVGAQTAPTLPTQIAVGDQLADLTISDPPDGRSSIHKMVTGDFDGDGVDDLLITNFSASRKRPVSGEAYVIYGSRSLVSPVSLNLIGTGKHGVDLTIVGPEILAALGLSAGAGDVNGDGIDDIIVSAATVGARRSGAIYVFFGSPNRLSGTVDLAETQADITILGRTGAHLGEAIAVADINGDGVNDLLFRHWLPGPPVVHAMLGPLRSNTVLDLTQSKTDIEFIGMSEFDGFGASISCADVNGDGIKDILIGRTGAGRDGLLDAGELDIFFGSPELKRGVEISLRRDGVPALIAGPFGGVDFNFGSLLGSHVATGDINNDGIQDIILGVGSFIGDGTLISAGEVYVVFGSPSLRGRFIDTRFKQHDLTIKGADPNTKLLEIGDTFGASITSGDFDGDGIADMLISAPYADGLNNEKKDSGEAYVFLGSSELRSGTTLEVARWGQDVTLLGPQRNDHLGLFVASGDVNGDGISDLIVQTSNEERDGQDSADIYVFFGGPIRPPEITKAKFKEGKSQLHIFGTDFTGDSQVEINGVIINREVTFFPDEGRLTLRGTRQELNLGSNNNQIVVIRRGTRSSSARVKG